MAKPKSKPGRKIAIVGGGPSYVDAPLGDPSWEIWSMAWRPPHIPEGVVQACVHFECHHQGLWHEGHIGPDYVRRLQALKGRLILRDPHPDLPDAEIYPRQRMIDLLGFDYHTSSFAYMLHLAIFAEENVEEIGVFGVDLLASAEYVSQRPNAEFLLGVAIGRGIGVTIAAGSALLKCHRQYGDP